MHHLQPIDIRELARTSARTGQIPEELVRYFDQYGKWAGDRRVWLTTTVRSTAQIMRGIVLPIHRRSRTENGRRLLLTSLIWDQKSILTADWHEIRGNVFIGPHSGVADPFLDTVCGSLTGASADKVNMPQLHTVGGDFGFTAMARRVETPLLRHVGRDLNVRGWNPLHLETVGGTCSIRSVLDVTLPNLLRVGGSLYSDDCRDFQAPILEEIGGDFHVESTATSVSLPRLRRVAGTFFAMSAVRIDAPKLVEVGGDAFTRSAPEFAPRGLRVSGVWRMHDRAKTMLELYQKVRELLRGGEDFYL